MTVKIIVATSSADSTRRWCAAFQQALPEASFIAWSEARQAVGAQYAIVWNPPAEVFNRERDLKAVFNLGAGVDGLMKLPTLPASLPIVRLEDAGMTEQMVEYVVYGLLRATREFAAYESLQRDGLWKPLPAIRREDWPVGVMGMGTIGTEVARAISSLGYAVAGWSRTPRSIPGIESHSADEGLDEFLARTRVLVNVLPLTPTTENILDRRNLSRLRKNAYLINVARGQHLVEDDLLALLDEGHMCGAMLDVFRTEPLPAGHAFWRHPKITVTPHMAAISLENGTVEQISGKIRDLRRDRPISGVVDRTSGY